MIFKFGEAELDEQVQQDLSMMAEQSITRKTWSTYKSAERMLAAYCREKRKPLELPVNESMILGFVHWLVFERNLAAGSVSGYLAGIKKLHVIKGLPEPTLRTKLVQMVLEGKKNVEAAHRLRVGKKRQPVTTDIMVLLKARIRESEAVNLDKLAVWAVSTLLFHGAFRGGELLSRSASWFDPAYTLLRKDVMITEDSEGKKVIQVKVKAPKEEKSSSAIVVDVFQTDTEICPAKAVSKWLKANEMLILSMFLN
jgi:hypothetical protein